MIATAGHAGARFGFRHLWVTAFGTLCTVFVVEMSGRFEPERPRVGARKDEMERFGRALTRAGVSD